MPRFWTPESFLKRNFNFLYHVLKQANRDDCWGLAAELGFQLMFSFFQALILIVAILSILGANPDVFNSIIYFLGSFLPLEIYRVIRNEVVSIAQRSAGGLFTLGLMGTVWTMMTLMLTLNKSFQRSYDTKERRSFWRLRLLAFLLSIAATLIIALVLALLFFGLQVAEVLESSFGYYNLLPLFIRVLRIPVAFGFTTFMVMQLYLAMSNVDQKMPDVLPGAVFFGTLWFLFTYAFGYYLKNFPHYNATYGTLGAFLILMIWMYLTSLSLLIGAEVNAEIHRRKLTPHPK